MKILKKFYISVLALLVLVPLSCTDEDLVPEPDFETAVHGFGALADGSAENFKFGDPSVDLDINLQWVSIDRQNTVNKVEIFVSFEESYVDVEGNPATARHNPSGLLLMSMEGGNVPGNREPFTFSITQDAIYQLYKDITFDYGKGEVPVWDNPDKPLRDDANFKFIDGDAFRIRWVFYTEDGRKFDTWNDSVCLEFPGANCTISWGVICESDLGGTYSMTSNGTEYYGSSFTYTFDDEFVPTGSPGKYTITDLSGGMEPNIWGNPDVNATVVDECGSITLDQAAFSYIYAYSILPGSTVNQETGEITIVWENTYGENGINVYTPK